MTLTTLLAIAANEPFAMPPDVTSRLTLYQLSRVVVGPDRDKDGRVEVQEDDGDAAAVALTPRQHFDNWCEDHRVPAWRAKQMWREWLRKTHSAS